MECSFRTYDSSGLSIFGGTSAVGQQDDLAIVRLPNPSKHLATLVLRRHDTIERE